MSLSRDYVDIGPPFDDSDADIILRSGFTSVLAPGTTEDRVVATEFLVHKLFLIKASSVFKSLLSSSSETSDQQNAEAIKHGIERDIRSNLPVLCLPEDRDTVHRLLTAIYPIDIVYPQTYETMTKTLAAARKYAMPSVLALFQAYCSRVAPVATAENAFRAYVFASNEGTKEEALEAAELTLSLPQTFETYGSSLCIASGPALRALWKHRGMVVRAIKRGVDLSLKEVRDLRDWKLNLPGDEDFGNEDFGDEDFGDEDFGDEDFGDEDFGDEDYRTWNYRTGNDRPDCTEDCCIEPAPRLLEQFVLFTENIPQNFSTMNFPHFINTMSPQGVFKCTWCGRQQRLDNWRLFDCLERHVRGQIEQASPSFRRVVITTNDVLSRSTTNCCHFSMIWGIDPQPPSGQPRNFGAPFDRGDSDVTMRSCDRVDFQVHKAILGIASVAFEDMLTFTAPGPSPYGQGQVNQVIDLTENSKTLLHLLSVIYPMVPIVPDTVEDALSLLSACQKYQMDFTATRVRALIRACTPPLFTAETSFRAYGIASRYHLEEEALLSARLSLERPMTFEVCGEDLRFISGADLFRLYGYRNECAKVAKDCIDEMTDRPPPISSHCSSRSATDWYGTREVQTVSTWWCSHFLQRIADRPSPKTVTDRPAFERAIASHQTATGCSSCMQPDKTIVGNIICAAFEAKLSEVIEQVSLDHALRGTPELMCIAGPSRCSNLVSYECPSPLCFNAFGTIEIRSEIWRKMRNVRDKYDEY